jgi:acetyl esterase/lipase
VENRSAQDFPLDIGVQGALEVLDRLDASATFFVRPSGAVFLAGFSQGGHAAFAAADLRASYAPEVSLTGIVGFGSTNDVATLLKEGPCYAPYILYTYARLYPADGLDPRRFLQRPWADTLEADVERMGVDEAQAYYPLDPAKLYTPEFYRALFGGALGRDFPALAARLAENRSGLSSHGLPALVAQGLDDTVIRNPSQSLFVKELVAAGSPVQYARLKGIRHKNVRSAGFRLSVAWMEKLARGEPPLSDPGPLDDVPKPRTISSPSR